MIDESWKAIIILYDTFVEFRDAAIAKFIIM
jgi:hypothetical protein